MNRDNLLLFLHLARQAYQNKPSLESYQLLKNDRSNDYGIEYLFAKDENNTFFLSFAGTNEIKDILIDLDFWQKTIPYDNTQTKIRIHKGFYKSYLSVRIKILSFLIQNKVKKICITGHSYGAALALLAAVDIQYNLPNVKIEHVVTFGCPRIGNQAFVDSFNKRVPNTYRIENGNDLVTKIPPVFMGYQHVGQMHHIGRTRKFYLLSILDHFAKNYKIKLEECENDG